MLTGISSPPDTLILRFNPARSFSRYGDLLKENVATKLGPRAKDIQKRAGRITVSLTQGIDTREVKGIVERIPGIDSFAFPLGLELDVDIITAHIIGTLSQMNFATFKMEIKRRDKQLPYTSPELNTLFGQRIVDKLGKKVDLGKPDVTIHGEMDISKIYVSFQNYPGLGGVPTNPKQKGVLLFSGGAGSMAAAYMLMRRGCQLVLVYFQDKDFSQPEWESRLIELAGILSTYQTGTRLFLIPFEAIGQKIIDQVQAKKRRVVKRQFMFHLARHIAVCQKVRYICSGDSLSRPGLKKMDVIAATFKGIDFPVLLPLIGLGKEEIETLANKINANGIMIPTAFDTQPNFRVDGGKLDNRSTAVEANLLMTDALARSRLYGWE